MRSSEMTGKYRYPGYNHYLIDGKPVSEEEYERRMWEAQYGQLDLFEEVASDIQHRR